MKAFHSDNVQAADAIQTSVITNINRQSSQINIFGLMAYFESIKSRTGYRRRNNTCESSMVGKWLGVRTVAFVEQVFAGSEN